LPSVVGVMLQHANHRARRLAAPPGFPKRPNQERRIGEPEKASILQAAVTALLCTYRKDLNRCQWGKNVTGWRSAVLGSQPWFRGGLGRVELMGARARCGRTFGTHALAAGALRCASNTYFVRPNVPFSFFLLLFQVVASAPDS
jgi:hypothetical protein